MSLPTPEQILALLQLLTPGILITAIRARAATGMAPDLKERILEFGVISVIYNAAAAPVFSMGNGVQLSQPIWDMMYSVVTPCFVGVILAYVRGYQLTYRIAGLLKLPIAHHLPTAWDYTFESLKAGTFVLVTLKDETKVPGKMASNSFASSCETERDLLIEELWEIDSQGGWSAADPPRHILICNKDIKYVEIF